MPSKSTAKANKADEVEIEDQVAEIEKTLGKLSKSVSGVKSDLKSVQEAVSEPGDGASVGPRKYVEVYHMMRILGMAPRHEMGVVTIEELNGELTSNAQAGKEIVNVFGVGKTTEGDALLFVFGVPEDGQVGYEEVRIVQRYLGTASGAVTGFQADAYLTSLLHEGWTLLHVARNGSVTNAYNMIWVLVK